MINKSFLYRFIFLNLNPIFSSLLPYHKIKLKYQKAIDSHRKPRPFTLSKKFIYKSHQHPFSQPSSINISSNSSKYFPTYFFKIPNPATTVHFRQFTSRSSSPFASAPAGYQRKFASSSLRPPFPIAIASVPIYLFELSA